MLSLRPRKVLPDPPVFSKSPKKQEPEYDVVKEVEAIMFPESKVPQKMIPENKQQSYEEIAESLGFYPSALLRAQIIAFFAENDIKLYNFKQVSKWLSAKKKEIKKETWFWRPFREQDKITNFHWGDRSADGYYNSEYSECRIYQNLVPLHALEKVKMIEEKFGDKVKFFISDFGDPKADPFIMVRPAGRRDGTEEDYYFVFDVWDEPGFGE